MTLKDLGRDFHRVMLKGEHPGWTDDDLQRYLEWEAANEPGLRDHAKKLWRILTQRRGKDAGAR